MPGSLVAQIVIPIISFLAVLFWVSIVLYASTHPAWKHKGVPPRSEVAGGSFMAVDGGRQLEPIPGKPAPEIPVQRLAEPEETYQPANAVPMQAGSAHSASAQGTVQQTAGPRVEESQSAGSGAPPS
jgi:hypothetical protein